MSCGGGTQSKTRHKTRTEQFGGTCSGSNADTQTCNTHSCAGKNILNSTICWPISYSNRDNFEIQGQKYEKI